MPTIGDPVAMNGVGNSTNGSDAVNGSAVNGTAHLDLDHRTRLERKMSTPLAPPFMVSAPGKVIVFGEHSVVHGKVRFPLRCPLVVI